MAVEEMREKGRMGGNCNGLMENMFNTEEN